MYDYDIEDTNMEHYKQPTPPAYNMTNIPKNVPLFLSYGLRDKLSDANDVGLLLDNLKDHDKESRTSLWYSAARSMLIWILL